MSDIRTRFNNLDIPKLYDAEDVSAEDKIIVAKLYSEKYLCYVSEYDKESGIIFGYCYIFTGEWGYASLDEILGLDGVYLSVYKKGTKFSELDKF